MNDFRFANPEVLFLLLALPLCWFALARVNDRARSRLLKFMAEANLRQLLVVKGSIRDRGKQIAFWLGLVLMILALARPQANPQIEEMPGSGLDIYVLLDSSRSMDAEDVAPSRLKKAKRTIQHLTERLSGDRLGVIAFANSAVLVIPLTSDYGVIDSYLKNVDTSLIPSQGTNLGGALVLAKEAMERGAKTIGSGQERSNIFIVLSDGEDHGESDLSIVDAIHKAGGLVFTVAFGTEKGVPIPVRDEKGVLLTESYKKNRQGEIVITTVKPAVLQEVAKRGGGQFYFSTADETEVEDILARITNAQRGSFTAIKTTVYEELFWAFLSPALLFLLFSFVPLFALLSRLNLPKLPSWRFWKWKRAASLGLLLLLWPHPASAGVFSFLYSKEKKASEHSSQLAKDNKFSEAVDSLKTLQAENPDSPELNYNIGTYFLQDKKGRLGREQLERLRGSDGPLRDLALFNSAGSFALEGKKDEARADYAELIQRLAGKAKRNVAEEKLLEQAKRNVARLADPAQQPKPQQDQSDQQKQESGNDQNKQPQQGQGGGDDKKDKKDNKDDKDKQDGKGGKDQKDKQGKGDDKKDQKQPEKQGDGDKDKKPDDKGEQDKGKEKGKGDEDKEKDEKRGEKPKDAPQGQAPKGFRQPFKERDNMGEEEAKRILGALKEQESSLQKNFLKKKVKGGRVNVDDADQDW